MEKLDLKDKKILRELDIDCRQSFRSIGRKVALSKDSVASRVKKLQKEGYIKYFLTSIDSSRLGYTSFRFYLTFKNTTKEIEKEKKKGFSEIDITTYKNQQILKWDSVATSFFC